MTIVYTSGGSANTDFSSFLVSDALIATQTGAADEIQIPAATDAAPSNATDYVAHVGNGTSGIGDSFVGRLCVLRKGDADEEIRIITAASFASSVTTIVVNEAWTSAPVANDTFDVCYELADAEDGGSAGGMALNAKSGLWEMSADVIVSSGGGLQIANGDPLEIDDQNANVTLFVQSGGYFFSGLAAAGADIAGGLIISYNGVTGEPGVQVQSGGNARIYDTLIWAQKVSQQFECANGSDARFFRTKWLNNCDELHLYDATVNDCAAAGKGAVTDIVRVDAGTTCNVFVASNIEHMDTVADTTTETVELEGVLFASVTNFITIRDNKTWNMIDPIWTVTDHTDFDESAVTGTAAINDRTSIKVTTAEADGTKLQDAVVNIYAHEQAIDGGGATLVSDLLLELVTAATTGFIEDSFIYTDYGWAAGAGTNTVFSGHALQAGKWLYLPQVFTQSSTDQFNGTIVLSPDANIVQTTQATALTDGSGVTWNGKGDAFPSCIIAYTGGTGTLSVGNTVTGGTSTAVGTVTQILSGDSTAGEVHLSTRTTAATFTNGEALTSTGWTGSPVYTAGTQQDFSRWIDANSKSLQTLYDYLAAKQTETTLSADGELIWEWCRDTQAQPLYSLGSSFFAERSTDLGLAIVNIASGTLDYMTDDANVQWVPPASVTIAFEIVDATNTGISGVQVSGYKISDGTEVIFQDTIGAGTASQSYTGTTPVDIRYFCRRSSTGAQKYFNISGFATVAAVSGASVKRTMFADNIADPTI
jgi:hypothetical protein